MKNKSYILCQTSNKKVMIYSVMKLKKIKEYTNVNFDRLIELLAPHDSLNQKTWFQVDIKLGVITLTFNKDSFNTSFNEDLNNYLEKLLDRYVIENDIEGLRIANPVKFSELPKTIDKSNSCGMYLLQTIFTNLSSITMNNYIEFFENNFYDNNGYIKKKFLSNTSSHSNSNTFTSTFEVYSSIDSLITIAGYIGDNFKNKFHIPNFLKDIVHIVYIINLAC